MESYFNYFAKLVEEILISLSFFKEIFNAKKIKAFFSRKDLSNKKIVVIVYSKNLRC